MNVNSSTSDKKRRKNPFATIQWAREVKLPTGSKIKKIGKELGIKEPIARRSTIRSLVNALANRADADHTCYPGVRKIARDTDLRVETVSDGLKVIEALGILKFENSDKHRSRTIRLNAQQTDYHTVPVTGTTKADSVPVTGTMDCSGNPLHKNHTIEETNTLEVTNIVIDQAKSSTPQQGKQQIKITPGEEYKKEIPDWPSEEQFVAVLGGKDAAQVVSDYWNQSATSNKARVAAWYKLCRLRWPDAEKYTSEAQLSDYKQTALHKMFAVLGPETLLILAVAVNNWPETNGVLHSKPDPDNVEEMLEEWLAIIDLTFGGNMAESMYDRLVLGVPGQENCGPAPGGVQGYLTLVDKIFGAV